MNSLLRFMALALLYAMWERYDCAQSQQQPNTNPGGSTIIRGAQFAAQRNPNAFNPAALQRETEERFDELRRGVRLGAGNE